MLDCYIATPTLSHAPDNELLPLNMDECEDDIFYFADIQSQFQFPSTGYKVDEPYPSATYMCIHRFA